MITKDQYCKYIIDEYKRENGVQFDGELVSHLGKSSRLAVAMEHLGLLQGDNLEYAQCRGGCEILTNDGQVLTCRELLKLLPK